MGKNKLLVFKPNSSSSPESDIHDPNQDLLLYIIKFLLVCSVPLSTTSPAAHSPSTPSTKKHQTKNSILKLWIIGYQNTANMTITSHFSIFLLAAFLLCTSILAAPADTAMPIIKAPEATTMSPYLTQLMQAIPLLPPPENATSLAASRKLIEDAIVAFNLNYSHLRNLGEEEVTANGHLLCETSGSSPRYADAIAAARTIADRGRCVMTRRCTEFSTWGEAAIGACAGGFQLWDFNCRTMWDWVSSVCLACVARRGDADRVGGKFVFDDGSGSDVRVYRN